MRRIGAICALGVALAVGGACSDDDAPRDHAEDHDHHGDHDHAEDHDHHGDHDHAEHHDHDGARFSRTYWSEGYELVLEHAPASAGEAIEILAYITDVDGYWPVEADDVELALDGPARLEAGADMIAPGIYEIALAADAPGLYRGTLAFGERGENQRAAVFEGIEIRAGEAHAHAEGSHGADGHGGHAYDGRHDGDLIELRKPQQWSVPFATSRAETGEVAASIRVPGTVSTPPGGTADVGAPVTGRLAPPPGGLPRPGDGVEEGQILATLTPAASSPEEATRATLGVAEAEARVSEARADLERAERLIEDEAISQRELEQARREVRVAEQALASARQSASLLSGAGAGAASGTESWRLRAPIAGVLTEVKATPGASVSPGTSLFAIVDDSELWLRADVPERDAAKLRRDGDVHYRAAGVDAWRTIAITGREEAGGEHADASGEEDTGGDALIAVGRSVDERAATVEVIYALAEPDPDLRVGGRVSLSLPVGDAHRGVVVPRSAVVAEAGLRVVYIQKDGEHFEERPVRTGPRAGERVAILSGLDAGERVVTRGAHLVRLAKHAEAGGDAHGHVH